MPLKNIVYCITDSFYRTIIDIKLCLYVIRILFSNRIRLVGYTVVFEVFDDRAIV